MTTTSKNKKKRQNEYKKLWSREKRLNVGFYLYYGVEDDMIQYLQQQESKSAFLKKLVREEMKKNNK